MHEEPDIETERLHEAIHEELEREGGAFLKSIALTTAILAALAAITSMLAGDTVNEALVLKTEATRLQAQASDQWAYYQAKGIKVEVERAAESSWKAGRREPPVELERSAASHLSQQATIRGEALKLEQARDAKSRQADSLLDKHRSFAQAVALFQVAIALGAVAALTRQPLVWYASMLLGAGGAVLFAKSFLG